mgnify:CR=1 FL=1
MLSLKIDGLPRLLSSRLSNSELTSFGLTADEKSFLIYRSSFTTNNLEYLLLSESMYALALDTLFFCFLLFRIRFLKYIYLKKTQTCPLFKI